MAAYDQCETPEDAWSAVGHHLRNELSIIQAATLMLGRSESEPDRARHERIAQDTKMKIVGCLYIIIGRLAAQGHPDEATLMKTILDQLTDQDIFDPKVRAETLRLYEELKIGARQE